MPEEPKMNIRAEGKEAMRRGLLDIASELLEKEGPSALSMRRIAKQAGCSTTILYTLFGAKENIVQGLYAEGFRRLVEALEAVKPIHNPLEHLKQLNRAYRQMAHVNPTYYAVMFERPVPEFRPSAQDKAEAWESMSPLMHGLQRCVDEGIFTEGDAQTRAMELWMLTHGLVSVELAGYFPGQTELADQMHEKALDDMFQAWIKQNDENPR